MSELPKLHATLRRAHTSRRRFRTLRLTIREWTNHRLVCAAQELPWDGSAEETREDFVRLWIDGPRMRVEDRLWIGVRNHDRWWVVGRDGQFRHSHELDPDRELDLWIVDDWAHFWDVSWLRQRGSWVVDTCDVAGRGGVVVETTKTGMVYPGADRDRCVIDAERGILLRVQCFYRKELIALEEAVEVAFDEELSAELFEEPR